MFDNEKAKSRCWLEINLERLKENYNSLNALLPTGCNFISVVKCNAYGHGAIEVSRYLQEAGCKCFAVATIDEALQLRDAGINAQILILGWTDPKRAEELVEHSLTQAVGDAAFADALIERLKTVERPLKIHIKLDTGMGRTGFITANRDDMEAIGRLIQCKKIYAQGIFTHFAVSDEPENDFTGIQLKRFTDGINSIENSFNVKFEQKHCANSGAVIRNLQETFMDMVRPGLALYGYYPCAYGSCEHQIRPAMTMKARVAMVRTIPSGESVSYGRTYFTKQNLKIAVVTCGYGDGLPRALSGNISFMINGKMCPQIGRICMDMCMVDVGDCEDCKAGDEVIIFGDGSNSSVTLDDLANKCGTISYELMCDINPRIPRIYE